MSWKQEKLIEWWRGETNDSHFKREIAWLTIHKNVYTCEHNLGRGRGISCNFQTNSIINSLLHVFFLLTVCFQLKIRWAAVLKLLTSTPSTVVFYCLASSYLISLFNPFSSPIQITYYLLLHSQLKFIKSITCKFVSKSYAYVSYILLIL